MRVPDLWRKRFLGALALFGVVLLASLPLAGCGGGGSSGGGGTAPVAGVSSGEIEGFGSVIVNGVKFETPDTVELEIEGIETPSLNDLREGMTIEVTGSFNGDGTTGTASSLSVEDNLEGPITAITETTPGLIKELTVLGQTVIVELGVTQFDNTVGAVTFATLALDQVIEVSGLPGATAGTVFASRIELKAATTAEFIANLGVFEIKGMVTGLGASTFTIGGLTIDFSLATITNGVLANGAMVEVKGTTLVGNTLTADTIEIKPAGLGLDNLAKAEIEGFVSGLSGNTFMLNGQMVDFSAATFRGGIEADLVNGVKVEAQGPIVAGVLQATKITFKETVRIEDNAATTLIGNTLTLEGLGLDVMIDATVTDNRLSAGFAVGDGIKLRGRMTPGGALLATRIEDVSPNNRVELQGPATDVLAPNLTILGIVIDTSTISEVDPSGSNFEIEDVKVSSATFFSAVTASPNPIVKARADLPAPLVWDQIELEIEDD